MALRPHWGDAGGRSHLTPAHPAGRVPRRPGGLSAAPGAMWVKMSHML